MPPHYAAEMDAMLAGVHGVPADEIASDELVFPAVKGSYFHYRAFRRDVWDPALKEANAARAVARAQTAAEEGRSMGSLMQMACTPHDLRATCASLLIDAGASVRDVADFLGHADITTTLAIYTRVRPGRASDLANRMDQVVADSVAAHGSTTTGAAARPAG